MKNIISFCLTLFLLPAIYLSQTTHIVHAGGYYYTPSSLTIEAGDSVTFINDGGNHDVVITDGPEILSLPACNGPCTIGTLKFNLEGEYDYICSIGYHASLGMVGSITVNPSSPKLALQGILDLYGSVTSGDPEGIGYSGTDGKALHLKATGDISDLSIYGLGIANNGGGTDGVEYTLPQTSVMSGEDILIYRVGDSVNSASFMADYFGACFAEFEHTFATGSWMGQNGDDPVELFFDNVQIEAFGDVDGSAISGDPYEDSWAYKLADGTWDFGGEDCDEDDGTYSVYTSGCPYPLCPPPLSKTYVPDDNFEAYLEANQMGDGVDGNDSVATQNIIEVERLEIQNLAITDLTGIQDFEALHYLSSGINNISVVDLSQNFNLDTLRLNQNQLSSIDITNNVNLIYFYVDGNQLTNLDISNNILLKEFDCSNNEIADLNLSNNVDLQKIVAEANELSNLDVSQNTLLNYLACSENNLTNLDISSNPNLVEIAAYENQLTSMDISQNPSIIAADFEINQLSCLNLKNGNNSNFIELWTQDNPALTCIEVDDSVFSNANWLDNDDFYIGEEQYFSNDCGYTAACFGACDSTIFIYDTVIINDTLFATVYDTVQVYDTIQVYDTLTTNVYDTTFISISVTDTLYIDVSITSAGISTSNILLVYPNPANDFVIIDNGDYASMVYYQLNIVNSLGQTVFDSPIDVQQFNISVSAIGPAGLYFINIVDPIDNIVVTKQLILE